MAFRGRRSQNAGEHGIYGAVNGDAPGRLLLQHVLADDNQGKLGAVFQAKGGFSVDVWQSRLLNNKAWYMGNGGDGVGGAAFVQGWAEVNPQTYEVDTVGSFTMANSYLRGNYAPPVVGKTWTRTGGSVLGLRDVKEWLLVNTTFATERSASHFEENDIYLDRSPVLTCAHWQRKPPAQRPCPPGQGVPRVPVHAPTPATPTVHRQGPPTVAPPAAACCRPRRL